MKTVLLISNLGKKCNVRRFKLVDGEIWVTSLVLTECGKAMGFEPNEYWHHAENAGRRLALRPDRSVTAISTEVWRQAR